MRFPGGEPRFERNSQRAAPMPAKENQAMLRSSYFHLLWLALPLSACSADVDQYNQPPAATDSSGELRIGSTGAEVERLHDFFTIKGYFPNQEIAKINPDWRPLVSSSPANPLVFDASTELAVRALQQLGRIEQTGVVDDRTRALLSDQPCGVPENAALRRSGAPGEPVEKYAVNTTRYTTTNLTWRITNNPPAPASPTITPAFARAQIAAAFADIAARSSLTFAEVTTGGNFQFTWSTATDSGGFDFAARHANWPALGGTILIDPAATAGFPWTTNLRFREIMGHEIGHAIGLDHSSIPACNPGVVGRCSSGGDVPRMNPGVGPFLTDDDLAALSVMYPRWDTSVTGCATDIDSVSGSTWVVGCTSVAGGFNIRRFNGTNGWNDATPVPGGALRVAVNPATALPWVVNPSGQIFRATFQNNTYTWNSVNGCANDIAFAANGTPWITGCDFQFTGFSIRRGACTGSSCTWTTVPGVAADITVDSSGQPWVTDFLGSIYRRNASGSWTTLPGQGFGIDIGFTNSPWVAAIDDTLWSLSEQNVVVTPNPNPALPPIQQPSTNRSCATGQCRWEMAAGRTGTRVTVGESHVWFVGGPGIYRLRTQ
jgi:hypothetical protein